VPFREPAGRRTGCPAGCAEPPARERRAGVADRRPPVRPPVRATRPVINLGGPPAPRRHHIPPPSPPRKKRNLAAPRSFPRAGPVRPHQDVPRSCIQNAETVRAGRDWADEPAAPGRCKCVGVFGVRCQTAGRGMFDSRQSRWRERVFWRSRREAGVGFAVADAVNPGVSDVVGTAECVPGDFADVRAGLTALVGDVRQAARRRARMRGATGPGAGWVRTREDAALWTAYSIVKRYACSGRPWTAATRASLLADLLGVARGEARTPDDLAEQTLGADTWCRRAVQARCCCRPGVGVADRPAATGSRRVLITNCA